MEAYSMDKVTELDRRINTEIYRRLEPVGMDATDISEETLNQLRHRFIRHALLKYAILSDTKPLDDFRLIGNEDEWLR